MATIPEKEPTEITAGDTVEWKRTDLSADYPAPTWTLIYHLTGPEKISITAAADGSNFLVSVPKATTAGWKEGDYKWDAYADNGTKRQTVDSGKLTIKPDFAQINATYDNRSHAKKTLDAIQAVIENRATKEHSMMMLGGRSIMVLKPNELMEWEAYYEAKYNEELRKERISNGLGGGRQILPRFSGVQ